MRPSRAAFFKSAGSALAASAATAATAAAVAPRPAGAEALVPAAVTLGNEVFLSGAWEPLRGRRLGIVTNQTGVTSGLESTVDAIRRNRSIDLRAIYSPEHGLRGDQPAGAYVGSYVDPHTGLPVYSLYGATRKPTAAMLAEIDVLLFDIQDVGDRAYTYIWTMASVMQAAKTYGKDVWILDRPNPIGGATVEGPVLERAYASFIGLYPIAVRHGMTVGELARCFNDHFGIGCSLHVVPMRGYSRSMLWPETGLSWVQTSPNIPEWDTTLVYPTTGLIDAAGINNGTNYTKPFKYAGAAGVDGVKLAAYLNARPIPGVHFRAASWTPLAGFWKDKTLSGVELVIVDPHAYRAVRTAVELILAMREVAPHVVSIDQTQLARDWGTDTLRQGLDAGESAEAIVQRWASGVAAFSAVRAKYLLY